MLKKDGVYFIKNESNQIINLSQNQNLPIQTGFREHVYKINHDKYLLSVNRLLIIFNPKTLNESNYISVCRQRNDYLLLDIQGGTTQDICEGYFLCNNNLNRGVISENSSIQSLNISFPNVEIRKLLAVNSEDFLIATNKRLKVIRRLPKEINSFDDRKFSNDSLARTRKAIVEIDNDLLLLGYPGLYRLKNSEVLEPLNVDGNFYHYDAIGWDNFIITTTEGQGFIKLNADGEIINRYEPKGMDQSFLQYIKI